MIPDMSPWDTKCHLYRNKVKMAGEAAKWLGGNGERLAQINPCHTECVFIISKQRYGAGKDVSYSYTGLILGLHPANEKWRYFVTMSFIGWAQA